MTGMLKLMDVGPNFGLPAGFVGSSFPAGGTPCVECDHILQSSCLAGEFDEDATNFFNFFVGAEQVLVAQKISEAEFLGFHLRFGAGEEGSIFSAQLFGRVARHPKDLFIGHRWFRPGSREARLG